MLGPPGVKQLQAVCPDARSSVTRERVPGRLSLVHKSGHTLPPTPGGA